MPGDKSTLRTEISSIQWLGVRSRYDISTDQF
jgi:hypothetical protein